MDFLTHLFDPSGWVPRWRCGEWTSAHGWLHILSDLGVWSAYVAIPCVLGYFLLHRKDLPFRKIFLLFVAFILACGTTHLMEAIIFWWPVYRLAGLIKLVTAVVSWATVIALVPVMPKVLAMRGPEELEKEIEERKHAEDLLRRAHEELENRVKERTAELALANKDLQEEVRERQRAETALRQTQAELELTVQQRTAELTQANQRLQASLKEKEVLLKEIHHRVKNNLQIISSLLDLQSQQGLDAPAVEMFRESQNRVRSMALIHERLYRSGDLARVDFTEYIEGLANRLFQSYLVDCDAIRLELHLSREVRLTIDSAIPCGLLVNELLSNCLKHAFKGRPTGVIRIELEPCDGGKVRLCVADNGVGLPEGLAPDRANTFGLKLASMLVSQLKGNVEITRGGPLGSGMAFTITFPLRKADISWR